MSESKLNCHGWRPLFEGHDWPKAIIIRMGSTNIKRHIDLVMQFGILFTKKLKTSKQPPLCLTCDYEFTSLPKVFSLAKASPDDPVGIASQVCPACARKSNSKLLDAIRQKYRELHMDPDSKPSVEESAVLPVYVSALPLSNGLMLQVIREPSDIDDFGLDGTKMPQQIALLTTLLENNELPRFVAYQRGYGNCHVIARYLALDLEKFVEAKALSAFSEVKKNNGEPIGLHSWVEFENWAVDASNGGVRPILIGKASTYREMTKMRDIFEMKDHPELAKLVTAPEKEKG